MGFYKHQLIYSHRSHEEASSISQEISVWINTFLKHKIFFFLPLSLKWLMLLSVPCAHIKEYMASVAPIFHLWCQTKAKVLKQSKSPWRVANFKFGAWKYRLGLEHCERIMWSTVIPSEKLVPSGNCNAILCSLSCRWSFYFQ